MTIKPKHKLTHPSADAQEEADAPGGFLRDNATLLAAGAATVAALGAAAFFNHARAREAEAAAPPAGRFVEVDGVKLHVVERGQGRPVVLLHGNGMTVHDFEASGVLDLAAGKYRVLAFDRPGFGYSERPRSILWTPAAQGALIARALKQLGVERPILVGHSWGALVALAIALDHPADVAGLVLLSGYYFPTVRADVPFFSLPAVPVAGDLMAHTVSPLSGQLFAPAVIKASFAPAPVPDKFARFPLGLALRPGQVRATAADTALMQPAALAMESRYPELRLPVAILAGEGDKIVHASKHAEPLSRAIPGSTLHLIPGEGHMLHYGAADRVIAAIDEVAGQAPA